MSDYIGVTDQNWFNYNKTHEHNGVVFWRRAIKPLNIPEEATFYFLVKGYRLIKGYGILDHKGIDALESLWQKYGQENGCETLERLEGRLGKNKDNKTAFYYLINVKYYDKGLDPRDLNINFSPNTVSGKFITADESRRILNAFKDDKFLKEASVKQTYYEGKYHVNRSVDKDEKLHLLEANLESILCERLEEIEEELSLIKRQYVTPVGRIDVLCKDKKGNLVVIELKKFGAKDSSIIDQIARYMGWIKEHVAKENQKVRGFIIIAKKNLNLEYAVKAIPNLEVKTFSLSIK